jgi:hypothetical protein
MGRRANVDAVTRTTMDGETLLIAEVLRQAVHDLRSARHDLQEEARRFLGDPEAVGFWCSLGGLDMSAFLARVETIERLRET